MCILMTPCKVINQPLLKNTLLSKISAMRKQTVDNKVAEIEYRKLITIQQTTKTKLIDNEPDKKEFKNLISPKLKETQKKFTNLQKNGVLLSPYLEVGSEHCLRPMILENAFNIRGFATDISLYSLKNAHKYAELFKFSKLPKIICADANYLPFKSNSFPFIFIYETLHHFPDLNPPLSEIYRVLSPGGHLLIGGDPIKQQLQIPLWRRPNKLRPWEKVLKALLILPFISKIGKTESEQGIIETAFDFQAWQKALSQFSRIEAEIEVFPFGTIEKTVGKTLLASSITKIALFLFGGGIRAICTKNGNLKKFYDQKNILICPDCLKKNKEILLVKLHCKNCKRSYFKFKNVPLLIDNELSKKITI